MPTITEILAAKKAAAAGVAPKPAPCVQQPKPAGSGRNADLSPHAPKKTIAQAVSDVADDNALLSRLTPKPLGKPALVLSKELPPTTPNGEPRGQATPIKEVSPEDHRRCLSQTEGETFDLTPMEADPCVKDWHKAMQAFATELCIMTDPLDGERAWLAVRFEDEAPLLLHSLPIYQHPRTVRPSNEPF